MIRRFNQQRTFLRITGELSGIGDQAAANSWRWHALQNPGWQ
jgi:hypothetical protein